MRRMVAAGTLAPADAWMVAELEKRLRGGGGQRQEHLIG